MVALIAVDAAVPIDTPIATKHVAALGRFHALFVKPFSAPAPVGDLGYICMAPTFTRTLRATPIGNLCIKVELLPACFARALSSGDSRGFLSLLPLQTLESQLLIPDLARPCDRLGLIRHSLLNGSLMWCVHGLVTRARRVSQR